MAKPAYETHEHDVIVIGAGGAGLRAAIEAAAQGVSVGLICKSLLGKAHTVMAEGGIAAAMGNVWPEDNWQVHFRDTMRGGKMLNNWRMAQLHAQEAPERVLELERWGALFDRTKDGLISQRDFGGHRYARLAHVGDRTGLEMIRTLQYHGIHQGIDVYMECNIQRLLKDGDRVCGAVGYWRKNGEIVVFKAKAVVLATGGIGKAWKVTSNSWEYTGDGHSLALWAGADLIDMEFVQFHPTGMVWPPSVRGILVTEGVRGDGGTLKNNDGRAVHVQLHPRVLQGRDGRQRSRKPSAGTPTRRTTAARPTCCRATRWPGRSTPRSRRGGGSPHGGVFLDICTRRSADYIRKRLPSMYHQFKELAGVDITKEPMEVGPTCHYVMGGVRVDADTTQAHGARALRGRRGRRRHARQQPARRQLALRPAGVRPARRAARRAVREEFRRPAGRRLRGRGGDRARGCSSPSSARAARTPTPSRPTCRRCMQNLVGIIRTESELKEALKKIEGLKQRAAQGAGGGRARLQRRLAHRARPALAAHRGRVLDAGRAGAQGEPRRPHPRRPSRTPTTRGARSTWSCDCATGASRSRREPLPEMPRRAQGALPGEEVDARPSR